MNKPGTPYPFLFEMLWVCGFFSLAAALFVLAFLTADRTSRDADALNHAVVAAQNAIETSFSTHTHNLSSAKEKLCFDRNWNLLEGDTEPPAYLLKLTTTSEDHMLYAHAEVTDHKGTVLYSLDGAQFLIPERRNP